MARASSKNPSVEQLRERAEHRLRSVEAEPKPHSAVDDQSALIHELRVHQIELEMQNDELRRTARELEASHERYFELYDLAPVGYLSFSAKGFILELNLSAASLLGGTRSILLNQPLSKFFLPEDLGAYFQHRKKLFDTGEAQRSELQLLTQDGVTSWVRLDSTVGRTASGEPMARCALIDVTRSKVTERQLLSKSAELEKALSKLADLTRLLR